jgi:hypothetical protein
LINEGVESKEVFVVVTQLARLTQKLAGSVLGSFGVAVQVGNVLICLALILFGFDVILVHLPQA